MKIPSKTLRLAAKAAVTIAVLWLVLRGIDFGQWQAMLHKQDWRWLAAFIALSALQLILCAWRWRVTLAAITPGGQAGMSFWQATKIYYIGLFFNTCLPGTIGGDGVRVWLTKSDHVPLTLAAHSVIIDRLVGLLALCLLITIMLEPIGRLAGFNALPWLAVIIAASVIGLILLFQIDRIMAKWRHKHVIAWLLYLAGNLRRLFKRPALSLALIASGIAVQILYCLGAYTLAQSLGIGISALRCIILIPPIPLAAVLPISIGGWGVREAGMIAMLSLAGVPHTAALMLSIQFGLATMIVNLPGGLLWMAHRRHAK